MPTPQWLKAVLFLPITGSVRRGVAQTEMVMGPLG